MIPGELFSPWYHTAQSQSTRNIILYCAELVFSILKFECISENESKNVNILSHWSVTRNGSKDEKTGGQKSRCTVPLREHFWKKAKVTKMDYLFWLGNAKVFFQAKHQAKFCFVGHSIHITQPPHLFWFKCGMLAISTMMKQFLPG